MLFVTYLLDAEADRSATWEEVCRIVPRIDPAREPARARRAYDTHTRVRWMVGWRHLMRRLSGAARSVPVATGVPALPPGEGKVPSPGHPLRWDRRGSAGWSCGCGRQ